MKYSKMLLKILLLLSSMTSMTLFPLSALRAQEGVAEEVIRPGAGREVIDPEPDSWRELHPFNRCKKHLRMASGTLEERLLRGCDFLVDSIIWEEGNGTRITYREWPSSKKVVLNQIFARMRRHEQDLGIACRPPTTTSDFVNSYTTYTQAFQNYAAHVAHALYLESTGNLPWSFFDFPQQEWGELLASYRYYRRIVPLELGSSTFPEGILPGRDYQAPGRLPPVSYGYTCDPREGYRFLSGETASDRINRIGRTPQETLANLAWFFAKNVAHGPSHDPHLSEFLRYRQSHASFIERLTRIRYPWESADGRLSIIEGFGCHSGANLFYELARSINIPVLVISTLEHPPPYTSGNDHKGIIYNFSSITPFVLWHFDNLNVNNLMNGFPLRSDGTPVSEAERAQFFFNKLWVSPAFLETWGFHYSYDLQPMRPGNYLGMEARDYRHYPELNVFGGWWESHFDERGYVVDDDYAPSYRNELLYDVCSYYSFIRPFCETGHVPRYIPSTPISVPVTHTQEELDRRAQQCLRAYGLTCDTVNNYYRTRWIDSWGLVGWQDSTTR